MNCTRKSSTTRKVIAADPEVSRWLQVFVENHNVTAAEKLYPGLRPV